MNHESKHDAETMQKHHELTLKTGPAAMFDMDEILDNRTLDIRLIRDEHSAESAWSSGLSVVISMGSSAVQILIPGLLI